MSTGRRSAGGANGGRAERGARKYAAELAAGLLVLAFSGCQIPPPRLADLSAGHVGAGTDEGGAAGPEIPEPVRAVPFVPLPRPAPPAETYTVVVDQVPVRELLFALARDAGINVDVHPEISGRVTLNAVDQTLPQLLDRISHQVPLRYEKRVGTLLILPDHPFLRLYRLDYVNVARDTASDTQTSIAVATAQGESTANTSATRVNNVSSARIWETLLPALREIVSPAPGAAGADSRETVIANPESGVIMVRASERQHDLVAAYLDAVTASLHRQVLIEATIVEVQLSDQFQAGVDFTRIAENSGLGVRSVTGTGIREAASGVTGLLLEYASGGGGAGPDVSVALRLLEAYGDARVLSSPKLMALNNQTAVLKVVDNEVYFSVDIKEEEDAESGDLTQEVRSTVNTVPVGLVMNVTPQISDAGAVSLNIRPTITRIREFVNDPGVALIAARLGADAAKTTVNRVPVVQVRETETVMRVASRQIAVLGGLMQDQRTRADDGTPGLSRLRVLGPLFGFRNRRFVKTELIIFIRATVVHSPSIEGDLRDYRGFLPRHLPPADQSPAPSGSDPVGDPS